MKIRTKRVFLVLAAFLLSATLGGALYLKTATYEAESLAKKLAQSSEVIQKSGVSIFQGESDKESIIFYQGAFVDVDSYAYLASRLAENGYTVYLLHSLFNLPVLGSQAAIQLIEAEELSVEHVVLAGHSLGGVVAASNAQSLVEQRQQPAALILLASYPADSTNLSMTSLPVLSITADQDRILNWPSYEKGKDHLPSVAEYTVIEGGNHSGFGFYGQQKGDGTPAISNQEQQEKIVQEILFFLENQ